MEAKNDADGTFGYTLEELLKIEAPPPPEDFAEFWEETYRLATARVPDYRVEKEIWSPDAGVKILQVRFRSYDGFDIGMWIARPESSTGGLVIGQGYGNPSAPPTTRNPGLTVAMPCIRGLGISQCALIPWKTSAHAGYGIRSRETYVIRGAVTDIWEATSVLADMFPDTASNLNYSGGSLGGGLGAILLPWDKRFKAGEINVPTLAGPMQFAFPVSGENPGATRRNAALSDPVCMRALSYFDGASAARRIMIPILMTPALSDKSNPPPAQFAIANAIPEEYRILRIREVGHRAPTPKDIELEKELETIRHRLFEAGKRE
jgi:cephalosporin-C deacetylase